MIVFLVACLTFYVAWSLGANDVANAMGTSVGSKAVTLRQALIIAGILEFTGAVLFGHQVSQTLATEIVNPAIFTSTPQILLTGMFAVLLACGLWLFIATWLGLPVSSSHAVVGAIAGFSGCYAGIGAIDWSSIGVITLGWIVTPILSATIAALFYSQIKRWILEQPHPQTQLREWIPWLSTGLVSIFGIIALPPIVQTPLFAFLPIPAQDIILVIGAVAAMVITFYNWRQLETSQIPHPKSPIPNPHERLFARFQLLSACFVAFAHGANDVGNAIAPLAVITYINRTGSVPLTGIDISPWILVIGGAGIVTGLAIWGKKVITTIGESIIPLQPSGGFCAELATATTILLASRFGLPVSTSHALVGAVVGIGLVENLKSIQLQTLQGIAAAWLITIPVSALFSAIIFTVLNLTF
ncbi:MAG: anion permease [Nostocaceae cyanobacterium]|nr:anion permease [Nostocaceae cyanobacterium]